MTSAVKGTHSFQRALMIKRDVMEVAIEAEEIAAEQEEGANFWLDVLTTAHAGARRGRRDQGAYVCCCWCNSKSFVAWNPMFGSNS